MTTPSAPATAPPATAPAPAAPASVRRARTRHFLMCPPTHFRVDYAINPWMSTGSPVDAALALRQWEGLRAVYQELGHRVSELVPDPALPDMVFTANGAVVLDGVAYRARFRHAERAAEADAHAAWLTASGFEVRGGERISEGEGDFAVTEGAILAGTGFRTEPGAALEAQEVFGRPVIGLRLVDPRYYHLDTALFVLDDGADGGPADIAYYPGAFSDASLRVLRRLFPDALLATEDDAAVFGLNAVSDGRNVVLPAPAVRLAARLAERGYHPVPVDMGEFVKAGGSVKCCTLEVRG
ncbi:dimethylargininase [Allonocardiopsis opalescens]